MVAVSRKQWSQYLEYNIPPIFPLEMFGMFAWSAIFICVLLAEKEKKINRVQSIRKSEKNFPFFSFPQIIEHFWKQIYSPTAVITWNWIIFDRSSGTSHIFGISSHTAHQNSVGILKVGFLPIFAFNYTVGTQGSARNLIEVSSLITKDSRKLCKVLNVKNY